MKKAKNQLLSRPLQIELKTLTPNTWSPIDEVSQIISDPKSRKKAQPATEQPSSSPPPPGSRFNPIYVEPGSVSIDSTRDLQALFPNSFDCIGDMHGEYDIKTDPTIQPVQHGRQKVPIEYKEEIEKELAKMVRQGIITKQTEPTPWVSSLMYPKKANSKLRICLDPKDLNKAIIRENHKAPTLEEIAMSSQEPPDSPRLMATCLLWDAPYRGSLTPHNVQHPPQKVQIFTCSLWTQNVTGYLPNEDGQHCGPMPWCIGHP